FSFEFAALDYSCPQKNQYAYIMEGFDHDWRRTDANRRFATYTNLPPGNYTFRVKASNNHGVWNESGTAIHLKITPPFWQTNWMLVIYISLILGAILLIRMAVQVRERNRAQAEMKRLEAEKIHELDQLKLQFFTHISHEFRTPLTLIIGPVERMLNLGNKLPQEKRDIYYRLVLQNARRLLRLVNQLMDARKLDTGSMKLELQHKEFVSFVKAIFSVFHLQAEQKNIRYLFKTELEEQYFYFDPDKIEKALYNVIANALKFTNPGGTLEVSLYLTPSNMESYPKQETAERSICVQVRDTGIGIPPDQIEHIFDPFYQVRQPETRKLHGTGIGLSISKDFIEMHGGRILVESTPGKGSTFTLIIPMKTIAEESKNVEQEIRTNQVSDLNELVAGDNLAGPDDLGESESFTKNSNKAKPLILIIEDDKDLRHYLAMELESHYSVIQAADGLTGYELAVERIPDLIICDVLMQVMDGNEFCHRCKNDQRTSHIPIILLTAQTSEEKRKEGLLAGADDYITKPFNPDLLHIRIENLLNTRRKIRERFSHLVYMNPKEIQISSPDEQFLQRIIEVVEQYLADSGFSVDDLSYHVGLSRAQLYRKMQALINQTPSEFIRNYRLQRAMQLLEKGHSPSQVCYQIGFKDPSYFTKCFRKQFGRTPQQVRPESEIS
ncbi:MAG TPA: hybrid sensor histidine kinase/response regulator transcription factor, partial [Candidatus Marinimicrobia bacterium]|nr:hybrid sensor histidine kinase/response regulator transcription factor [Candidatus Neomarinimicrobiota bacterium]